MYKSSHFKSITIFNTINGLIPIQNSQSNVLYNHRFNYKFALYTAFNYQIGIF